jgi:hypothetical protein
VNGTKKILSFTQLSRAERAKIKILPTSTFWYSNHNLYLAKKIFPKSKPKIDFLMMTKKSFVRPTSFANVIKSFCRRRRCYEISWSVCD